MSLMNLKLKSQVYLGNYFPLKKLLMVKNFSLSLRKGTEKSMENIHTDIRVLSIKHFVH